MKKLTKHRLDRIGVDVMEKRFEKGSEEWQFFMDYWRFCQKYYIAETGDTWLQEAIDAGSDLAKKYKGLPCHKFAIFMVMGHLNYLAEEVGKLERGKRN